MNDFIVPISGLPSITSVGANQSKAQSALENLPFADMLQSAVENLNATKENSSDTMYNLAMGGSDDLHTGAVAALKYNTAVTYTSSVASAVVKAYNELMRMSV